MKQGVLVRNWLEDQTALGLLMTLHKAQRLLVDQKALVRPRKLVVVGQNLLLEDQKAMVPRSLVG
jgi:hypothetical protein